MPDAPDRLLEEGGLPQPPKGWRMTADLSRALLVTTRPDEGFARLLLEQGGDATARKLPELSVAVTMTASNRRPANPQRREAAFDKSLRRRGRRHVHPAGPEASQIPTLFEYAIEPMDRPGEFAVVGTGSCRGDDLGINSLFFAKTGDVIIEPSLQAGEALQSLYQGPTLNQGHAVATVLGRTDQVSPTAPLRQRHNNRGNPFFDPVSVHTKFGHLPAHTVAPPLYDAIMGFMRVNGFDAELAAYLKQLDGALRTQAEATWRRSIVDLVVREPVP